MVVFGTGGAFTRAVLEVLIEHRVLPSALVLPGASAPMDYQLPVVAGGGGTVGFCARHGMPVLRWSPGTAPERAWQGVQGRPDVALVACFSHRLEQEILKWPRHGCFNLHPSLLPRYRGPAPLFWQFRAGESGTGVSLHQVVEPMDAGPIVARSPVSLPDGISGREADVLLAVQGTHLFLERLRDDGPAAWEGEPQDGVQATYQPWPGPADFILDHRWSPRRAYNFMRGTAEWGRSYTLDRDGRSHRLGRALGYDEACSARTPAGLPGNVLRLPMGKGLLYATVNRSSSL